MAIIKFFIAGYMEAHPRTDVEYFEGEAYFTYKQQNYQLEHAQKEDGSGCLYGIPCNDIPDHSWEKIITIALSSEEENLVVPSKDGNLDLTPWAGTGHPADPESIIADYYGSQVRDALDATISLSDEPLNALFAKILNSYPRYVSSKAFEMALRRAAWLPYSHPSAKAGQKLFISYEIKGSSEKEQFTILIVEKQSDGSKIVVKINPGVLEHSFQ